MINIDEKLLNRDLVSPDAFWLLCIMATYANKGGESVFPSNATLVVKTKFAEKKVIQLKKELIAAGLLTENTEKRKENLAKKLAKTAKEFTNVSKVYAVNNAYIGKFVSKNTEIARFERNCQFGKLPHKVVTSQGSYLKWQSKYWVSIETSIEEFERIRIEKDNNTHRKNVCAPEDSSFSFSEVKSENPTEIEFGNPKHFSGGLTKIVNSENTKQFSVIYDKAKQLRMSLRSFETEFEFISKKENPAELLNVLGTAIENYEKSLQAKYAGEIDKRYIKSFKNFIDENVYEIYSVSFDVSDSNREYIDYEGIKFEVVRTTLNGKKYGNDLGGKEFQLTGAAGVKISLTNPQNTEELNLSRIIKGQINQFKNHGK